MKTYVEKNFDKNYLKKINIQQIGVYYSVPVKNIFEDKRNEFIDNIDDLESDTVLLDWCSIDCGEFVENYNNIKYEFTEEIEIEDTINNFMNYQKYNHYLVVLFNCRWTNASGYKFFNNYKECFYRDYECSMYVIGSCKSGKYLELKEYHHDKPTGHNSVIIGLTDNEFYKLYGKDVETIINYGTKCLEKIEVI